MTHAPHWIDGQDAYEGRMGFLVIQEHNFDGWRKEELWDEPPRAPRSREPRLYGGWSTDNVHTQVDGIWRVAQLNPGGTRALIEPVEDERAIAYLQEMGFPELIREFAERTERQIERLEKRYQARKLQLIEALRSLAADLREEQEDEELAEKLERLADELEASA